MITQNENDKKEYGRAVWLKPSELNQVIENYSNGKEILFYVEELRPSLIPAEHRISVTKNNEEITIEHWIRMFSFDFFKLPSLTVSIREIKEILTNCCDKRNWYQKEIGIAPLVGINCRESEKDVEPIEIKHSL
jgi:hypothetical protein